MLIYRKLKKILAEQEEVVAFLMTSRVPKDSPTRMEAKEKLQALNELNSYTDSFEWVKTPKTLEKVKVVIQNNFDYEVSANQLGTTVKTLKVMFSRCDSVLKAKIEQPLKLIEEGKFQEGVDLFLLGSKELELQNYKTKIPLLDTVLNITPIEPSRDYSVVEYINALKFIKIYSKPQFQVGVERSGKEHINYLLHILLNPSDQYNYQKTLIIQFLNNEIKLEELVQYLSEFEEVQRSVFFNKNQEG